MNSFRSAFKLLIVLIFFWSCAKKTDGVAPDGLLPADPTAPAVGSAMVVSSKTANAFTVTWGAATDDLTPVTSLMYKLVYSASDNLTSANLTESNGTIALDWATNTLTANLSSLAHSTTYYLAAFVRDADNKVSLLGGSTVTLCTGKKMFLASVANGSFGGKAGADAACLAQRPGGVGSYKAMLGDSTGVAGNGLPSFSGRQACYGNCEVSNLYVFDWVFTANQNYCTSNFVSRVGTTGPTYPVLYVPIGSILSNTQITLFTGFNIAWGNSTGTNCNNWSTTSGTFVGGSTDGIYTGQSGIRSFIANGFPNCSDSGAVVCVEQ